MPILKECLSRLTEELSPPQYKLINDLVDGKIVKIKEEHRFNSSKWNVIIASMDYWENRFAKIIQRNWDICRYNLKYTICKKILNEQYDEYESQLEIIFLLYIYI